MISNKKKSLLNYTLINDQLTLRTIEKFSKKLIYNLIIIEVKLFTFSYNKIEIFKKKLYSRHWWSI